MGKPKQKIYWVIVRANALFKKFDITSLNEEMAELKSTNPFGEVKNLDSSSINQVFTAAFLHCKSKQDFQNLFGNNCLVYECSQISASTLRKNLRKARIEGFDARNTTSCFVFWWDLSHG